MYIRRAKIYILSLLKTFLRYIQNFSASHTKQN